MNEAWVLKNGSLYFLYAGFFCIVRRIPVLLCLFVFFATQSDFTLVFVFRFSPGLRLSETDLSVTQRVRS